MVDRGRVSRISQERSNRETRGEDRRVGGDRPAARRCGDGRGLRFVQIAGAFGKRPSASLCHGLRAADRRFRIGGGARFLLGSAIDFLVEDSCVLCRRPHPSPHGRQRGDGGPGRVVCSNPSRSRVSLAHSASGTGRFAPLCAERLVVARSAGVLGRRRRPVEYRDGDRRDIRLPGRRERRPDRRDGGDDASWTSGQAPDGAAVRILSPFMTTTQVLKIIHLLKFGGYVGLSRADGPGHGVGRTKLRAARPPGVLCSCRFRWTKSPCDAGVSTRPNGSRASSRSSSGFPSAPRSFGKRPGRGRSRRRRREDRARNVRDAFACRDEGRPLAGGPPGAPGRRPGHDGGDSGRVRGGAAPGGSARPVTVLCFGRAM